VWFCFRLGLIGFEWSVALRTGNAGSVLEASADASNDSQLSMTQSSRPWMRNHVAYS